jgi:hypothetical protein
MGFFGHADWMVTQYDGNIGWMNLGDDSDYDLVLVPGNVSSGTGIGHGITANNNELSDRSSSPRYIELESPRRRRRSSGLSLGPCEYI